MFSLLDKFGRTTRSKFIPRNKCIKQNICCDLYFIYTLFKIEISFGLFSIQNII